MENDYQDLINHMHLIASSLGIKGKEEEEYARALCDLIGENLQIMIEAIKKDRKCSHEKALSIMVAASAYQTLLLTVGREMYKKQLLEIDHRESDK